MNTLHLSAADRARIVRRIRRVSRLMDDAIRVPLINYRIGLDPIIGLIPGAGDVVSVGVSVYTILAARRLGYGGRVLGRMALNVLLDFVVGTVPVVGDLADFLLKANQRNVRLLGLDEEP